MFNQKRIEVNIGDVFVEYFHNKRKILSMMGLSKDFEISNFQINDLTKQNVRKFPPMNKETRLRLIEFFKPYNQELYNLVNRNFNWDV